MNRFLGDLIVCWFPVMYITLLGDSRENLIYLLTGSVVAAGLWEISKQAICAMLIVNAIRTVTRK